MKTNHLIRYIALAGLSLCIAASAETQQADATAVIQFKGNSTLHDFEGLVKTQPFTATFFDETPNGPVLVSAKASFTVLEMSTDHGKRDKNMRKMLDQKQFPIITGTLTNAELPTFGTNSTANLHLRIRDIEQEVPVTLSEWERAGNLGTFRMTFPISLKAFDLKAPSVLGLIRVGDTVEIDCSVTGTFQ
ncbi:YceI family protein [Pontiellaceae bacterium B1224]|nr:YceI family protein [Pontiellaceae bacterium B1224]